jgi:mannose-6-phosphate isomerase-like protein (cupin superfamily)
MIKGKIWGSTKSLLITPFIEVHRIHINPKMKCSVHTHAHKWNAFYIFDGVLEIHVEKNNYNLTDVTTLQAGDFTTVQPGEYHWFVNNSNFHVDALEIYYPEPLTEDIIRKTCGGTTDGSRNQTDKEGNVQQGS